MSIAYQIGFTAGENGQGEGRMSDVLFETIGHEHIGARDCQDARRGFEAGITANRRRTWDVRYTTAPEAYDSFHTFTVAVVGTTKCGHKTWRKVMIDPRHTEWHEGRYGSGLHPCHTQKGWDELVEYGLVVAANKAA